MIIPVAGPGRPRRAQADGPGRRRSVAERVLLAGDRQPFNAAQDGRPSASLGILSNVARRVEPEPDEVTNFPRRIELPNYPTLLQLDAKLNLGMSGGAVVNMRGELVGLTTMASSPSGFDAMAGYAIPMDRIGRRAVETLRKGRRSSTGCSASAHSSAAPTGSRKSPPIRRPRKETCRPTTRSCRSTTSSSRTSTP